ncbi:MAG: HEAT repeat domain-containing protein [Candidatus Methylomirabilales bacterium]
MVRDESKNNQADADLYRELAEILVGVKKAIKTFQFYAGNHPARAKALDHTHKQITELLAQRAPLSLQINHEGFSCDDVPVGQDHLFLRGFASELALRGIQGIRFLHGARLEDLQHFTELLTLEAADLARQGGGRAFLQGRGASTVEVDDLHVEFFEASSQPESAIREEGPAPEPSEEAAPSAPAEVTAPQSDERPEAAMDAVEADEQEETGEAEEQKEEEAQPDLEKLIAELQKTDRPARYETITEELSRLGREAWTRGEDHPCLRIMTALGLELHPKNPKEEKITRYARWTLRSLLDDTGPQLVIEGFCRGGMVSEDDVVHLLLMLKEEMAEAVVQQLVIERDVTTRRKLEDLLVQMGDVSLPVVRSALKAPSREAVRRLFPLLPKLQAPDTPEILQRLLRHYNPLIRAESVRLLGRMQIAMTDEPLLKALADPETSVRQAAMAVLGGTKVKAAVAPLRRIAEEPPGTRDIEEQKMAIAALGAIGEPEALLTLIALLRRKRWFQRRATETLRIAAAYALGKLGGPQAEEALQAVGQSARPALKHACEVVLKNPHASEETREAQ